MVHRTRDDLILYGLVCGLIAFGAFVRSETYTWTLVSFETFAQWVISATVIALVQIALLRARCALIHRRAARHNPDAPKQHLFMQQHFHLVTRAALIAAIGVIVIYDGYWRLDDAYSRPYPNNPAYFDLLWLLGYGVGLAALVIYVAAMVRQIGRIYQISRAQSLIALGIGLLPEIVLYGILGSCFLALAIMIGPSLA
jgi:hypothetical protein